MYKFLVTTYLAAIPQFDELEKILPGNTSPDFETSYAVQQVVPYVVQLLLQIAAATAVISIILGGAYYIASMGDDGNTAKAKTLIMWSIIGLIAAILSYAVVDIIIAIQWE
jgi:hypothetical protein